MHAAHAADQLMPGAQIEVIGVGEDDRRAGSGVAEGFERVLGDGLDRGRSADGHEDRGFYGAVRKGEASAASAGGGLIK